MYHKIAEDTAREILEEKKVSLDQINSVHPLKSIAQILKDSDLNLKSTKKFLNLKNALEEHESFR